MNSNMFIPSKLKIGFCERSDTFTKKLAYVIYYDEKGKLRKQSSWESWRDKNIEAIEIDNNPTTGYVLNKGVRRDGYWGSGRSVIRIYDPRDFEFEIDVSNLIGLLSHSDVLKREIQQECVFAWWGTELVLLPTNSVEYQESQKYTEKQSQKISAKTLIKGARYVKKKSASTFIYIGYENWYAFEWGDNNYSSLVYKGKKHVFYSENRSGFCIDSVGTFASCVDETPCENYSQLVDEFNHTRNSSMVVGYSIKSNIVETANMNTYNNAHLYADAPGDYVTDVGVTYCSDKSTRSTQFDTWRYHSQPIGVSINEDSFAMIYPPRNYSYWGSPDRTRGPDPSVASVTSKIKTYRELNGLSDEHKIPDSILEKICVDAGLGVLWLKLANGNEIPY